MFWILFPITFWQRCVVHWFFFFFWQWQRSKRASPKMQLILSLCFPYVYYYLLSTNISLAKASLMAKVIVKGMEVYSTHSGRAHEMSICWMKVTKSQTGLSDWHFQFLSNSNIYWRSPKENVGFFREKSEAQCAWNRQTEKESEAHSG